MTSKRSMLFAACPLTLALMLASCGGQHAAATARSAQAARAGTRPLASSLVNAQGSWAIAPVGGFWQLLAEPAGAGGWSLVTPPGVADNGGLVATSQDAASSVTVGFRPSQGLVFSPLATSTDTGKTWAPGVLGSGLADTPDALSTGTGGESAALFGNGVIQAQAAPGGAWSQLTTIGQLAASPAGKVCGLTGVSAVAVDQGGTVLVAGSCAKQGTAGIVAYAGGSWTYAPPDLPARYGQDTVRVLRMTSEAVLLGAGPDLLVSWRTAAGWGPPAALPGADAAVRAAGFGSGRVAWVLLAGGRAAATGPSGAWRELPAVPAGTAALAQDTSPAGRGGLDALAVSGDTLTVWRQSAAGWARAQVINVPIVAGSSA